MPESKETLDAMAAEVFELSQLIALARSRRPAGADDLSESEFVTLDILEKSKQLTIGEVQKRIGVAAAQMSRIVRALEKKGGKGYVACKINAGDKRRVDIALTPSGRKSLVTYRSARMATMYEVLKVLKVEDRLQFMGMLRQIRRAFEEKLGLND